MTTSDLDVRPLLDAVEGPVLLPHDEGFAAECAGFTLLVVHDPVEDAFGDGNLRRLRTVKSRYDPATVFRANDHNIVPNA